VSIDKIRHSAGLITTDKGGQIALLITLFRFMNIVFTIEEMGNFALLLACDFFLVACNKLSGVLYFV